MHVKETSPPCTLSSCRLARANSRSRRWKILSSKLPDSAQRRLPARDTHAGGVGYVEKAGVWKTTDPIPSAGNTSGCKCAWWPSTQICRHPRLEEEGRL